MSAIETVQRYYRAIDSGDFAAATDLIAPDARVHLTGAPEALGREALIGMLQGYRAGFPDFTHTIEASVQSGDRLGVRVAVRATHLGEFNGVPATGRRVQFSAHGEYRVTDGRIAAAWVQFDALGLMRQIGPDAAALEDANIGLAHRVIEAYNTTGMSGLDEVLTPDYVHHDDCLPQPLSTGVQAHRAQVGAFRDAFPDYRVVLETAFAERDAVLVRWRFEGTNTGSFMGGPATGRRVSAGAVATYRVANGRVAEGWVNVDFLAMMQQLGLIPSS